MYNILSNHASANKKIVLLSLCILNNTNHIWTDQYLPYIFYRGLSARRLQSRRFRSGWSMPEHEQSVNN